MKYHKKIISLIIDLKINEYLLKYFYWHLSDIELSLLYISYISLKFQRSFQTVQPISKKPAAVPAPAFLQYGLKFGETLILTDRHW
jgi:hypothetical protein